MATLCGWTLLTVLLFAVYGCALVEVNVKPPEAGLEQPIPGGNQRQVIVTIPFRDGRQSTSPCGVQKGGWGNETAQAVCQGNPTQWIAEFLARELRASGFTVLPSEEGARATALKVEGERMFFAKGEKTSVIWPQGIFNDSVERGSRDLLTKMVEAILELMKRYPELGLERRDSRTLVSWTLQTER